MQNKFTQISNKLTEDTSISDGAFRTYVVLRSYKYHEGKCFPSIATIAKKRGRHPNTVLNHLGELEKANILYRKRRGYSLSNEYLFNDTTNCANENSLYTKNSVSIPQEIVAQSHNELGTNNIKDNNIEFKNISSAPSKPKGKCPNNNGHKECMQFIESFANTRGVRFPYYQKQINAVHNMLHCGYSFESIQVQANKMNADSFWRSHGFDLTNVANEIAKAGTGEPVTTGKFIHPNSPEQGKYDDVVER